MPLAERARSMARLVVPSNLTRPKSLLAAAAVLALAGAGLSAYVMADPNADRAQEKTDDEDAVVGAKSAIETRMADAEEVTYGQVFVHWLGTIPSVCGQVDIREEQDSFDGAERFIYSEGALQLEENDGSDLLEQKWNDLCK
jgi:hypothetical protein